MNHCLYFNELPFQYKASTVTRTSKHYFPTNLVLFHSHFKKYWHYWQIQKMLYMWTTLTTCIWWHNSYWCSSRLRYYIKGVFLGKGAALSKFQMLLLFLNKDASKAKGKGAAERLLASFYDIFFRHLFIRLDTRWIRHIFLNSIKRYVK